MTEFTILIAGVPVQIQSIHAYMQEYCRDYLTDQAPAFCVQISQEDIEQERQLDAQERILEGLPPCTHSDEIVETTAVYRKIANRLIDFDVLLFHGSTVAVDGDAYLFTAKSGTGKSTHTKLWRKYFGQRAVMINDDKPLLKISEEGVLVCGTPWDGKHKLNTNCMVPLKSICVLKRGEENEIRELSASATLPVLMQQSHRPANVLKYMELMDRLTKQVKFYELHCNMDPDAARVAFEGMQ